MKQAVHIPWYATLFRGDKLHQALELIAPVAQRYGATSWAVYRSMDDMYKFLQVAEFDSKEEWNAYWNGPEFVDFRIANGTYFQVPVLYGFHAVTSGSIHSNGFVAS